MSAVILLLDNPMKPKSQRKHVDRNQNIPASHGELMMVRAEMMSRHSAHDHRRTEFAK